MMHRALLGVASSLALACSARVLSTPLASTEQAALGCYQVSPTNKYWTRPFLVELRAEASAASAESPPPVHRALRVQGLGGRWSRSYWYAIAGDSIRALLLPDAEYPGQYDPYQLTFAWRGDSVLGVGVFLWSDRPPETFVRDLPLHRTACS